MYTDFNEYFGGLGLQSLVRTVHLARETHQFKEKTYILNSLFRPSRCGMCIDNDSSAPAGRKVYWANTCHPVQETIIRKEFYAYCKLTQLDHTNRTSP